MPTPQLPKVYFVCFVEVVSPLSLAHVEQPRTDHFPTIPLYN